MNPIAPLLLREFPVETLHVDANPNFNAADSDQYESKLAVDFGFHRAEGKPSFRIDLDVRVNLTDVDFDRAPYRIWIKTQTFLEFDPGFPEENIPKMLGPNGLAMAYGIARGIVGQSTGTSLHGRFILPTVNFVELLRMKSMNAAQKTKPRRRSKGKP
jgi:preprotein translocase subunit SecB